MRHERVPDFTAASDKIAATITGSSISNLDADLADPLLTMARAARHPILPEPVSPTTMWRWAKYGLWGHKLRSVSVGGKLCTRLSWLVAFFEALGAARAGGRS